VTVPPAKEEPVTSPADELRTAAQTLRALVAAIRPPDPAYLPFHADGREITQGARHGLYDVAMAVTPELAAYIAAMGPNVGALLAKLLDDCADLHEAKLPGHRGQVPPGCQWCGDEDFPCADVRNALAVARAITTHPTT
jgi:hypothetical protein